MYFCNTQRKQKIPCMYGDELSSENSPLLRQLDYRNGQLNPSRGKAIVWHCSGILKEGERKFTRRNTKSGF